MEPNSLIVVAIFALLAGLLIGYALGNSGNQDKDEALHKELADARRELEGYRKKITGHFSETATLVNELTDSYKNLHQHLANSAQTLCVDPGDIEQMRLPSAEADKTVEAPTAEPDEEQVAPKPERPNGAEIETATVAVAPKDYAPKSPKDEGTLSETYGLKEAEKAKQEKA